MGSEMCIRDRASDDPGIFVKAKAIDLYLLTATIAQRLAAGDLELVEKGDSCGKKAYYDKLCREIRRDYGE